METLLNIDLLSLFPEMINKFFESSILAKAQKNHILKISSHNIRSWAKSKHKIVDDRPFGGGPGMVLKAGPIGAAIDELRSSNSKIIYLCPDGQLLTSELAKTLANEKHIILISGHYEGVDQRIRDIYVDQEISIGDYILTNGILASAILIDVIARFIPGVLGSNKSLSEESFSNQLLAFPQYTRPFEYKNSKVPLILLSGNHEEIKKWRLKQRINKTKKNRPDLISN